MYQYTYICIGKFVLTIELNRSTLIRRRDALAPMHKHNDPNTE